MNSMQVNKRDFEQYLRRKQAIQIVKSEKRELKQFAVARGEHNDSIRCMVCGQMVPVRENETEVTCQCGNYIKFTPRIMKKLNKKLVPKIACKTCLDSGLIFYNYQRDGRLYSGVGRCKCSKGQNLSGYSFLPIVDERGHLLEKGERPVKTKKGNYVQDSKAHLYEVIMTYPEGGLKKDQVLINTGKKHIVATIVDRSGEFAEVVYK